MSDTRTIPDPSVVKHPPRQHLSTAAASGDQSSLFGGGAAPAAGTPASGGIPPTTGFFGQQSSGAGMFGQQNAQQGMLGQNTGNQQSTITFGQNPQNAQQPARGTMFGGATPAPGGALFGGTSAPTATPAAPAAPAGPAGSSLLGATARDGLAGSDGNVIGLAGVNCARGLADRDGNARGGGGGADPASGAAATPMWTGEE